MALEPLQVGEEDKQKWRGPWWSCFGRCTTIDCLSCCTAYWAPCVAYGFVSSKVLNVSFWRAVAKFALVFGLYWLFYLINTAGVYSLCIHLNDASTDQDVEACRRWLVFGYVTDVVALACVMTWAICVGGPSRTQLRQRLGVPATGAGGDCCTCCHKGSNPAKGAASDRCLHFWCLCCALAQEMRTVMHLEAAHKLPLPTPEGYEPLVTQAPAVDSSMSRVVGVPVVTQPAPGSDMV